MKQVFTAMCFAAACAVGVSAQQSATTTSQKSGQDNQNWGQPMSLTGCLRAGLTAGTFDLTNVKDLPAEWKGHGKTATGTTGATGTSGSTADTDRKDVGGDFDTVTLAAEGNLDMSSHVGHEVKVTGRLPKKDSRHVTEGAGGDRMSSGGAVGAGSQPSGMSTMTSGHGIGGGGLTMRVSSMQMLSSSCDAGK
jgi:hypothetical protein